MQFFDTIKNLDSVLNREYKSKLLLENIRRLKVVGLVGFSVNTMILLFGIGSDGLNALFTVESVLRLIWSAAAIIYIFIVGSPQNHEQISKKHRIIFYGAAALSLLFSAVIMGILLSNTGYTFLYIVNCMVTSSFLFLSFLEILFVMMPSICYLTFILIAFSHSIPFFQSNVINIIAVTVFSMMIASMSYRNQMKLLESQNIINENNNLLKELVDLDGLTNIPNRRKFDEVYSLEWAHANRDKKPLTLIMIDMDYFKKYNDYYGHLAGDDCLKQIAHILKLSLLRKTDFVCRYGGEEFIVVLPNTELSGALHIAELIRQNVSAAGILHKESDFKEVTLSMGIATLAKFNSYTKEELIFAADKAMYTAKQKGRNRIATGMLM